MDARWLSVNVALPAILLLAQPARAALTIPRFPTLTDYLEWLEEDDTLDLLGADRIARSRRTPNCLIAVFPSRTPADQQHEVLRALAERFLSLLLKETDTPIVFVEGQNAAGRVMDKVGLSVSGQAVVMGDTCE